MTRVLIFFLILCAVPLVLYRLFLDGEEPRCSGNCQQGKRPCDCGEKDD